MENAEQSCPVCLDAYKDPRCFPCLHVFCKNCLSQMAEQERHPTNSLMIQMVTFLALSCPLCRHKVLTKEDKVSEFPSPIKCRCCSNFVKKVVQLQCGHINNHTCLECITTGNENESIRCPECNRLSQRSSHLPQMFLCSACHCFKAEEQCRDCAEELLSSQVNLLIQRYALVQQQHFGLPRPIPHALEQQQHIEFPRPTEHALERQQRLQIPRPTQHTRNYDRSSLCSEVLCATIFFFFAFMLIVPACLYDDYRTRKSRSETHGSVHDSVWYVDRKGQVYTERSYGEYGKTNEGFKRRQSYEKSAKYKKQTVKNPSKNTNKMNGKTGGGNNVDDPKAQDKAKDGMAPIYQTVCQRNGGFLQCKEELTGYRKIDD